MTINTTQAGILELIEQFEKHKDKYPEMYQKLVTLADMAQDIRRTDGADVLEEIWETKQFKVSYPPTVEDDVPLNNCNWNDHVAAAIKLLNGAYDKDYPSRLAYRVYTLKHHLNTFLAGMPPIPILERFVKDIVSVDKDIQTEIESVTNRIDDTRAIRNQTKVPRTVVMADAMIESLLRKEAALTKASYHIVMAIDLLKQDIAGLRRTA